MAPTSTVDVVGAVGARARPGAGARSPRPHSATKRSATGSSTSTRSVRMQTWPLCANPLQTAACAARGRSASASTIIADLPPSSSTDGHQALGGRARATCRPDRRLPVKKIMSARSTSAAPASPRPGDDLKHAGGQAQLAPERGDAQRRQRRVLGRLQHDGVAGQQRRRRSRRSC